MSCNHPHHDLPTCPDRGVDLPTKTVAIAPWTGTDTAVALILLTLAALAIGVSL